MKRIVFLAAFAALSLSLVAAEEESVSLDDIDTAETVAEEETGGRAARVAAAHGGASHPGSSVSGTQFHVFGDFGLVGTSSLSGSDDEELTFGSEHAEVFVAVSTDRGVSAATEIVNIGEYLEFTVQTASLAPSLADVPVLGRSTFKVGNIMVPFGEYKYHHLYGGSVEASETLMAVFWTDLGASVKLPLLPMLNAEAYVINGLRQSGEDVKLDSAGKDDGNLAKALGAKARLDIPNGFVTGSVLFDRFGDDRTDEVYGNALLVGLDAGYRLGPLSLTAGGMGASITGTTFSRVKTGWFGELKAAAGPRSAFRLRCGQVDPDLDTDEGDLTTASLGFIQKTGLFDLDISYTLSRDSQKAFGGSDENDAHKLAAVLYFML